MAWKHIVSYICTIIIILIWNDALHLKTLEDFNKRFKALVDELSIYFQPCGFPIELVARFCALHKPYKNQQVNNYADGLLAELRKLYG